jgi:hypothetical protein
MPTLTWTGKEAEDLTRHDKWLCMMYPRLALINRDGNQLTRIKHSHGFRDAEAVTFG